MRVVIRTPETNRKYTVLSLEVDHENASIYIVYVR